jgi:hypothetical protein
MNYSQAVDDPPGTEGFYRDILILCKEVLLQKMAELIRKLNVKSYSICFHDTTGFGL